MWESCSVFHEGKFVAMALSQYYHIMNVDFNRKDVLPNKKSIFHKYHMGQVVTHLVLLCLS